MALLYAVHDQSGHALVPAGGWIVESIAIAENPQPQNWTQIRPDINWILRLNWAHNGKDGTIPLRGQYDEFAKRCADYMAHTGGVQVVIIANEPNHAQEYPNRVPISPEDYADCFNGCYRAITYERPDCEVMAAAVAPWDVTSGIDWLAYYKRMLAPVTECDGLAIHGYSHGADPNLIWSAEKVQGWYWHFPVIYQTIQAIPPRFATRPVHVTETDQGDEAWLDRNAGWVQNAYQSVDDHNRTPGTQKIYSLALYRWRGDKYEIHNKPLVQEDFKAAVKRGYISPGEPMPTPPQPQPPRPPRPPRPEPPQPTPPEPPPIVWDKRLTARGCTLQPALMPTDVAPIVTVGRWFDKEEAQGRTNIFVRLLDENGKLAVGVPVTQFWSSGSATRQTERKADPWLAAQGLGADYSLDWPMYEVAPSYGIRIEGDYRGDVVNGCGLGSIEQPDYKIHTAYFFEWQLSSEGVTAPIPPTPIQGGDLVHPLPGAVITQHWGEPAPAYGAGIWGHDGTDLAGLPEGTPVYSMAAGKVAFTGWDEGGYGNYVRCEMEGYGAYAFYAHLQQISVKMGQTLKAGDVIGLLGTTGNSTGAHLHTEIRLHDEDGSYRRDTPMAAGRVDPETWCCLHGLRL
jgi:hypothetical protein